MTWDSYKVSAGDCGNEVHQTAEAYLDAAETYYRKEIAIFNEKLDNNERHFFHIHAWFVVHHLSYISCELFFKSMGATYFYTREGNEDGPVDEYVESSFEDHNLRFDRTAEAREQLEKYLSVHEKALIDSVSENGIFEFSRGRYPFERKPIGSRKAPHRDPNTQRILRQDNPVYPTGDAGKEMAEIWLQLARKLAKFQYTEFCFTEFKKIE